MTATTAKNATMRIGVDLGGTKIEAIALDSTGAVRARKRVSTPRDDYTATLLAIRDLVSALESETGVRGTVGIGTPGAIARSTGRMKNANSTWLNDRPLREDLERTLERPVRLANDANCLAVSEATDGGGAGARVVFAVILGTGVGGGIAIDARVWEGANAIAGEWGHNPLPSPSPDEIPGPLCYCGRNACIETFLSGPGLVRDHVAWSAPLHAPHSNPPENAEELAKLASAHDPLALATLARHSNRLARALGGVINLLDPDVIVLGGGVSRLDGLIDRVTAVWDRYVFSDAAATRLVLSRHGDTSGVRGAAWLWPLNETEESK